MADCPEFRCRFRDADHDNAVRSAYKVLAMMIDEFESGTAYGIDNDEDGTPCIYAAHESMTRESFHALVSEATRLAAEDNTIVYVARVMHDMLSHACDMLEAKATDEEIARYLLAYEEMDELSARMKKLPFRGDFDHMGPLVGERLQGILATIRIIKATERPPLSGPAN